MPGAISATGHSGSRSESLAAFTFSTWGTVVSTPNQQDYGIDLHCTLVDTVGSRAWSRSPYTVQVKSNMDPWVFESGEAVRWLIDHPLPLFLCVVDKPAARLRLYHTSPRFLVSLNDLPPRLTLTPAEGTAGECVQWESADAFSLSAPILEVNGPDFFSSAAMDNARAVLEKWIEWDNANLGLRRAGLLRFRMPHRYTTNDPRVTAIAGQGRTTPTDEQLQRGICFLAEALDCLGSQFHFRDQHVAAVKSALMLRELRQTYEALLEARREIGSLYEVNAWLNERLRTNNYAFQGIDQIASVVRSLIEPAPAGTA